VSVPSPRAQHENYPSCLTACHRGGDDALILAAMVEILNAHGSKNDIFVAPMWPRDFASESDLHAFVRRLCDRNGPLGGDGI
jgi:hypothetical protein